MYANRYTDENTYQVIEYYNSGSRVVANDAPDYLEWIKTNEPTIEANGRFLSVVDGKLVVAPDKDSILKAELEIQELETIIQEKMRELLREQAITALQSEGELTADMKVLSNGINSKS